MDKTKGGDIRKTLRFNGEIISLFFVLIIVLLISYAFFEINIYLLIGSICLGFLYVRLLQAQHLGNSLQVSENQFSEIYNEAKKCADILQIKKMPKLFITQDPTLNAFTMGFRSPYTIVLNSGIVENLSLEEIKVVIGHEMGHAKFKHCFLLSLLSPIGRNFVFSDLLFGFWARKNEYTSDRCGLVCSGDKNITIKTLIKIATGAKAGGIVDLEKLSLQLQDLRARRIDRAGELLGSHPYILKRIWEINKFAYQYNCMPCKNCLNINVKEANFCWACGKKI